jgi:hypothetical protein
VIAGTSDQAKGRRTKSDMATYKTKRPQLL